MVLNKKIAITHVIIGLDIGGAELMLKRLVLGSDPDRYVHRVLVLGKEGAVGRELSHRGIEVRYLGLRSTWQLPLIFFRLLWALSRQRPAIVQSWMYHADLLGGLAAKLVTRAKIIWGVRTTDPAAGNALLTLKIARYCARLSNVVPDRIICAAQISRRSHIAMGYSPTHMHVVPNGFEIERFTHTPAVRNRLRAEWRIGHNEVLVGAIGRLNAAKDFRNFVCAMLALMPRYPMLRAVLIGRALQVDNSQVRAWFPTNEYLHRFIFLGERVDVPECLSALDIFCLSSRSEGFPNVLGEAMASGISCVTTDVGDAAYLLADTGIVVPPENAPALANGLEALICKPPCERAVLGAKAKARIQTEFSLECCVQTFEHHYYSLANEN